MSTSDRLPTRVVMATFEYDVVQMGGLSTMLTALCRHLDRTRFQPVVVLPRSSYDLPWTLRATHSFASCRADVFDDDGTEVWALSNELLDGPVYGDVGAVIRGGPFVKGNEYGDRLGELLPALRPDLVHQHDMFGARSMPAVRALGLPSLMTVHSLHPQFPHCAAEEDATASAVDLVVSVGESYCRDHHAFFGPPRRTRVVPNGIDLSFWSYDSRTGQTPSDGRPARRAQLLERLGLAPRPTFAFVGRIDAHQKGVDLLVDAHRLLAEDDVADFNLLFFGDGEPALADALAGLAAERPDRVHYTRRVVDKNEVREIFAAVDFAVVPSRFEPFGLIQLEALAMGAVVVGARTGGLRDVLVDERDEGGFARLFTPGSADELASAMCDLVALARDAPARLLQMQRRGLARLAHFSAAHTAAQYQAIYEELLAARAARETER